MAKTSAPDAQGRAPRARKSTGSVHVSDLIRVRATAVGFYGDVRRRIGDVFDLYPRTGTFTEVEIDDKTGKPLLDDSGLIKSRITREVEDKTITAEQQFNKKWMERVSPDTPERASSANEQIRAEHAAILERRFTGGQEPPVGNASGDEEVI